MAAKLRRHHRQRDWAQQRRGLTYRRLDRIVSPYRRGHYDRKGRHITFKRWVDLRGRASYVFLRQTHVNRHWVSTVWLGVPGVFRPTIFETMVFCEHEPSCEVHTWCYRPLREREALRAHNITVDALRSLKEELPEREPSEELDIVKLLSREVHGRPGQML